LQKRPNGIFGRLDVSAHDVGQANIHHGILVVPLDIHIGKPSDAGILVGSMEVATTQAF